MKLITVKELSEILKVHRLTVYRYIEKGMPVYRDGEAGHIRIELEEALEWLKK